MNKEEIKMHIATKAKDISYPKLPEFILKSTSKNYKNFDKSLQVSCIRGFRSRLKNWENARSQQLLNLL
jgi:hypothetical protein